MDKKQAENHAKIYKSLIVIEIFIELKTFAQFFI